MTGCVGGGTTCSVAGACVDGVLPSAKPRKADSSSDLSTISSAQRKVFTTPPYTKRTVPELGELYQDEPALTKLEGVPEGPQRKNHVV